MNTTSSGPVTSQDDAKSKPRAEKDDRRSSSARRLLLRAGRLCAIAAVSGFLAWNLWKAAGKLSAGALPAHVDVLQLVVATLLCMGALGVSSSLWYYLLRINGSTLTYRRCVPIFFYSHLVRYLPGQVWTFVGKVVLSTQAGIRTEISAQGVALEAMVGVLAGLTLSLTVLPSLNLGAAYGWPLLGPAIVSMVALLHPRVFGRLVNLGLRVFGRPPVSVTYTFRQILTAYGIQILAWLVFGVSFSFFVQAIAPGANLSPVAATGIFSASWLVGYLSVLTPAGIGVREAVLVVLLSRWMPAEVATLVSLGSRVWITGAEVLGFFVMKLLQRSGIL
jgi:hypothetical protein